MTTDKIVYTISDSGMDGRSPPKDIFAAYDKDERDDVYEASKNKSWYAKGKRIVEVEPEQKQALAKLDAVQRLLLDVEQKELK